MNSVKQSPSSGSMPNLLSVSNKPFIRPGMGAVYMREIIVFYDMPVLFTCENPSDAGYYVCVLVEHARDLIEDRNKPDTWLYARMSKERIEQVEQGFVDLHDAFALNERVIIHTEFPGSAWHQWVGVPGYAISERWLPEK